MKALKEQLRQKEEQLQANQQQASLLAAELRDASSTRDRTMSELYHMKLEVDALRQAKAEAQAQCIHLEHLVEQLKADAKREAVRMTKTITAFTFERSLYKVFHLTWNVFNVMTGVCPNQTVHHNNIHSYSVTLNKKLIDILK